MEGIRSTHQPPSSPPCTPYLQPAGTACKRTDKTPQKKNLTKNGWKKAATHMTLCTSFLHGSFRDPCSITYTPALDVPSSRLPPRLPRAAALLIRYQPGTLLSSIGNQSSERHLHELVWGLKVAYACFICACGCVEVKLDTAGEAQTYNTVE